MKKLNKFLLSMLLVGSLSAAFVGCNDEYDRYEVNSPSWLSDSVAAAAERKAADAEKITEIEVDPAVVGNGTQGWWANFTQNFELPKGQILHIQLDLETKGEQLYHNFCGVVTKAGWTTRNDADTSKYKEYYCYRGDGGGWCDNFDADNIKQYFTVTAGGGEINNTSWDLEFNFTSNLLTMTYRGVDKETGKVFYTKYTENDFKIPVEELYVFLCPEMSKLTINRAWLSNTSDIPPMEDSEPVSLEITKHQEEIELGQSNVAGSDFKGVITYADGSEKEVDSTALSFSVTGDLKTIGEEITVYVMVNKTLLGETAQNTIVTSYTAKVVDAIGSIEIVTPPTAEQNYIKVGEYYPTVNYDGIVVTGKYGSGEDAGTIANENLQFSEIDADGNYTVTYTTAGGNKISTKGKVTPTITEIAVVKKDDWDDLIDDSYGTKDVAWWTLFLPEDVQIKAGEAAAITFNVEETGGEVYHHFPVILRKSDKVEYYVIRWDNYGWRAGDDAAWASVVKNYSAPESWTDVFATFAKWVAGSTVKITVANFGGTARVIIDAKKKDDTFKITYDFTTTTDAAEYDNFYVNFSADHAKVTIVANE